MVHRTTITPIFNTSSPANARPKLTHLEQLRAIVQPNIDLTAQLVYNIGMADTCRTALEIAENGGDIKHFLNTLLVGTDITIDDLKAKLNIA